MSIIAFICRFVSPFHTAGERYSNVHVCAPYVLGSTLRGAMLGQIIQRSCPEEHFARLLEKNPDYHSECPGPCGAKDLFCPTRTRFSFGEFDPEARPRIFRSRVAIDRERFSVAEGALLTFDAVPGARENGEHAAGSRFRFEVEVTSPELVDLVKETAIWAGEAGVGAFRNQGYGRFVVEGCQSVCPEAPSLSSTPDQHRLRVRTPWVLGDLSFGEDAFRRDLSVLFGEDWCDTHFDHAAVTDANLGYIGRWCYEDGKRHVRAVALPGSALALTFNTQVSADDVQRLLRGIGEWSDMGFGRWSLDEAEA